MGAKIMCKTFYVLLALAGAATPAIAQVNCTQTDVGNGTVLTNCTGSKTLRCTTFTLPDGRVITNCT
jgi:hypothetical protein